MYRLSLGIIGIGDGFQINSGDGWAMGHYARSRDLE